MQLQQADIGVHALAVSVFSTQLSRQTQKPSSSFYAAVAMSCKIGYRRGTTCSPKDLGRQVWTQTDVQDMCKVQPSVDLLHLSIRR